MMRDGCQWKKTPENGGNAPEKAFFFIPEKNPFPG